jgi:hypothetical protein
MEPKKPSPFLERVSSTTAGDWWLRAFAGSGWVVLLVCLFLLPGARARKRIYEQDPSCSRTVGQPPAVGACTLVPAFVTKSFYRSGGARSHGNWELDYKLSDGQERELAVPDEFHDAFRRNHSRLYVRMFKGEPTQYVTGDAVSKWGGGPGWDLFNVELAFWWGVAFAVVFSYSVVYRLRHPRVAG